MELDLRTIFPLSEPDETDALDAFISERLCEAGVWGSPRRSDGIKRVRVVEFEPACVRVCGWIYEVDQTLHSFWLDLQREGSGTSVAWALYFNVIASTPRQTRDAIDLYDRAEQLEWQVALVGCAEVQFLE